MVICDGTIRNETNVVIQYQYGDNGIDQTCQTEQYLNMLSYDKEKMKQKFELTEQELNEFTKQETGI